MLDKGKVLSIVKERGPVLPRDIVKEIGGDTFFTGAILSQLVSGKEIKISYAKIGGSPVYYASGQEPKLEILYKYLPQREKEAYDMLKTAKVIRDVSAAPAIRVALRSIKDFAKPLEVTVSGEREIFWKWYLCLNEEAETIIRKMLSFKQEQEPENERQQAQTATSEKVVKVTGEEQKEPDDKKAQMFWEQQKIQKAFPEKEGGHELLSKVKGLFSEKGIQILDMRVIRKNSEIEMEVLIPSPAGKLRYFCKIKDKKKSNDKDLSSLFVESQMKKLPVLYVTPGGLTKKAAEMLEKEFKMISVMHL